MKKTIVALLIVLMMFFVGVNSYALFSTIELDFEVVSNEDNEEMDVYLLLPERYIKFAMLNSIVETKYDGANTLKNNDIPGIEVKKENVQDEVYEENGVEYTQILLEPDEDGIYRFDLLEEYNKLDIKYRVKNEEKDYILHIDNFKIENRKCEIQYNYDTDIVKQPDKTIINFVDLLFFVLVAIIIIGTISYIKKRR